MSIWLINMMIAHVSIVCWMLLLAVGRLAGLSICGMYLMNIIDKLEQSSSIQISVWSSDSANTWMLIIFAQIWDLCLWCGIWTACKMEGDQDSVLFCCLCGLHLVDLTTETHTC